MDSLTKQNLLKALKQGKAYTGTQPFVQAMASGNEKAIQIVNEVFLQILGSDKAALMSKLLVLRMFKDIFIAGNMDSLDRIDAEVEEVIISAAAYNPKFKAKGKNDKETRGGMYFVETERRAEGAQVIQLGNSFVLLATEIIKYFAAWLPENPDDQSPSRFLEAYEELEALGVSFNTSIYFQPAEEKKFKTNYQNWLKNRQQASKQPEKVKDQQKKQEKAQKKVQIKEAQPNKQPEEPTFILKEEQSQLQRLRQEMKEKEASVTLQIEAKEKQIVSLKQNCRGLEERNVNFQARIQKLEGQLAQSASKVPKVGQQLQQQKKRFEEELRNANEMKSDAFAKIANLEKTNKELQKRYTELKQQKQNENKARKQSLKDANRLRNDKELEEARRNQEILESQIRKLQNEQKDHLNQKQGLLNEITRLREALRISEMSRLQLTTKLKQIPVQKEIVIIEKEAQKPQQEPSRPLNNTMNIDSQPHLIPLQTQADFFNHFQQQQAGRQTFYPNQTSLGFANKKSSNSLHKTESTKLRQNRASNGLFKENSPVFPKEVPKRSTKKIIASIFPFMSEYFSPLIIKDSGNFRACCIVDEKRHMPFFVNQSLEMRLLKSEESPKYFQIAVKNKTGEPLHMRMNSETEEIKIKDSHHLLIIDAFNEIRVQGTAHITNLNFRYPILNFTINQGRKKQNHHRIPIPLTLLNFTTLSQSPNQLQKFDRFNETLYRKHKSQRIVLNNYVSNIHFMFPQLKFEGGKEEGYFGQAVMSYVGLPEVSCKLNIMGNQRYCEFETEFLAESKISEAFSKVILQLLMFVCI